MSGAGHGGRGNAFWDAERLGRLRKARDAGINDRETLSARFGVGRETIKRGVQMLKAEDDAKAAGGARG